MTILLYIRSKEYWRYFYYANATLQNSNTLFWFQVNVLKRTVFNVDWEYHECLTVSLTNIALYFWKICFRKKSPFVLNKNRSASKVNKKGVDTKNRVAVIAYHFRSQDKTKILMQLALKNTWLAHIDNEMCNSKFGFVHFSMVTCNVQTFYGVLLKNLSWTGLDFFCWYFHILRHFLIVATSFSKQLNCR